MPSQFTSDRRHKRHTVSGDGRYNVVCARCGLWFTDNDIIEEPRTRLMVCLWCCNPVHPIEEYQLFVPEDEVIQFGRARSSEAPDPPITPMDISLSNNSWYH